MNETETEGPDLNLHPESARDRRSPNDPRPSLKTATIHATASAESI